MLVGDSHGHVNPVRGMGPLALAERFRASGGWLYCCVNLLSWSLGIAVREADDYRRLYDATVRAAERMRERGLVVPVVLGPHPAEVARLADSGVPPMRAAELALRAYEIARRYVEEGAATGLGEVGRPHWRTPRGVVEACNWLTERVVEMAAEIDAPVHLHMEQSTSALEFAARLAREYGAKRVVAHHTPGRLAEKALSLGLLPSVLAKRAELEAAASVFDRIVVESDFLDDPRRPGAVVAPWSIARTVRRLVARGVVSEAQAERALVYNPARLYSVEPPV